MGQADGLGGGGVCLDNPELAGDTEVQQAWLPSVVIDLTPRYCNNRLSSLGC